jgi:hypothetical protein
MMMMMILVVVHLEEIEEGLNYGSYLFIVRSFYNSLVFSFLFILLLLFLSSPCPLLFILMLPLFLAALLGKI